MKGAAAASRGGALPRPARKFVDPYRQVFFSPARLCGKPEERRPAPGERRPVTLPGDACGWLQRAPHRPRGTATRG